MRAVYQPITLYALSLDKPHTFCITHHGIIVHNEGFLIAIGVSLAFETFKTASIEFLGSTVCAGLAAFGSYIGFKLFKKHSHGCCINNPLPPTPTHKCFEPVSKPSDFHYPQAEPSSAKILTFPEQDPKSHNFIYDIVVQPAPSTVQTTQSTKQKEKTRYNGPYAHNWNEFVQKCPIGQQHSKKFVNTGKQNPKDGAPLYKVKEDVPGCEMFKKGRFIAIDRMHGDHMEVWDQKGNWVGVANLDGTKNYDKSEIKDKKKRNIQKII